MRNLYGPLAFQELQIWHSQYYRHYVCVIFEILSS